MKNKKYILFLIILFLIIKIFFAQEINTEGIYKNYGAEDWESYLQRYDCKNLYDLFGNYMLTGRDLVNYSMRGQSDLGIYFFKSPLLAQNLGCLVIVRDEFEGTKSRFMLGQEIATNFTSLTLKKPQYNGFRWDILNDKTEFSFLTTITDAKAVAELYQRFSGGKTEYKRDVSYYLVGVHNVSRLGDLIKVGLTFLDQYNMDTRESLFSNSFKGIDPDKTKKSKDRFGKIIVGDITGQRISGFDIRGKIKNISFETEIERNEKFFDGLSFEDFKKYRNEKINKDKEKLIEEIKNINEYITYLNARIKEIEAKSTQTDNEKEELKKKKDEILPIENNKLKVYQNAIEGLKIPTGYADVHYHMGEESYNTKEYNWRDDKGITYAGFLKLKTDIKGITLGIEKYRIDPYYSFPSEPMRIENYGKLDEPLVSFSNFTFVDDNDDNDRFPDEVPYCFTLEGESISFNVGDYTGVLPGLTHVDKNGQEICNYDINQNNIPDYNEDFFLNYCDPPDYNFGYDRNNNGYIDVYENDRLPDYPYARNLDGYFLYTNYYFDKLKTKLELEYKNEKNIIGEANDFDIFTADQLKQFQGRTLSKGFDRPLYIGKNVYEYLGLNYENKINWFGNIFANIGLKNVQDNILNDCIEQIPNWEEGAYVLRPNKELYIPVSTYLDDLLLMQDSLVFTKYVCAEYTAIDRLKITTKFKNETNIQKNVDNTISSNKAVYRAEYKFKLSDISSFLKKYFWTEKISIIPSVKYISLNVNTNTDIYERTRSKVSGAKKLTFNENVVVQGDSIRKDENKRIFILMGMYEFSENLRLVLGKQIRKDVNNIDDTKEIESDFTGNIWSIQLIQKSNYKGYEISTTLGFKKEKRDYKTLQLDGKQEAGSELIFIKLYLGY